MSDFEYKGDQQKRSDSPTIPENFSQPRYSPQDIPNSDIANQYPAQQNVGGQRQTRDFYNFYSGQTPRNEYNSANTGDLGTDANYRNESYSNAEKRDGQPANRYGTVRQGSLPAGAEPNEYRTTPQQNQINPNYNTGYTYRTSNYSQSTTPVQQSSQFSINGQTSYNSGVPSSVAPSYTTNMAQPSINSSWGGNQPPANHTGYNTSYPAQQPPKKTAKTKRKSGKLAAVFLVLACFIAGFGGSVVGNVSLGKTATTSSSEVAKNTATTSVDGEVKNTIMPRSISEIAAKAKPSVVSIITENLQTNPFYNQQVVSGAGSGVIISEDGYIITNNHVVDGAQSLSVTLADGTQYPATLVGKDAQTDIAVIKIDVTGLVPATISDSDTVSVGDFCMAIGNPLGVLSGTVTDGIVSALDREVTIEGQSMNLMQMDAAVSPGNSGGGLFDENGDLIGIVNAKTSGENSEGLGFAIPVNTAMEIAQTLIENGYVTGRPSIGISVVEVTSNYASQQYTNMEPGVYIAQVAVGGAGEKYGLKENDKFISINGETITQTLDISKILNSCKAGDTIEIVVSRDGQEVAISLVLGEMAQ